MKNFCYLLFLYFYFGSGNQFDLYYIINFLEVKQMKKKVVLFVAIILVVTLFSCVLIGCNKDNENSISTPKDFWDKYLASNSKICITYNMEEPETLYTIRLDSNRIEALFPDSTQYWEYVNDSLFMYYKDESTSWTKENLGSIPVYAESQNIEGECTDLLTFFNKSNMFEVMRFNGIFNNEDWKVDFDKDVTEKDGWIVVTNEDSEYLGYALKMISNNELQIIQNFDDYKEGYGYITKFIIGNDKEIVIPQEAKDAGESNS